ncbi:MAG: hypothetical protein IIA59_02215 [Candidatus Marinimicrobia bacterium]|nr:hypothetical protein [Candidatus Neomarinimicrobiota bacterium]
MRNFHTSVIHRAGTDTFFHENRLLELPLLAVVIPASRSQATAVLLPIDGILTFSLRQAATCR